jgi:type I restriction enzyme S subunit
MRPYPHYRPSGVDWLGDVPEGWEVSRLKHSIASCRNGIWGDDPETTDDPVICVRVADFDRQALRAKIDEPTYRAVTEAERQGRLLRRGNLLLEKSGGGELQPVGAVVLFEDDVDAVCSNFVARVELAEGMHPNFWLYAHRVLYDNRVNVRSIKQTSGIQNLDQSAYFDELFVFPPLPEQQAIAGFLDGQVARIDALVAEQRRLIDFLAEKRQAVISQAVTRGLNPNTQLKPSGIDWLGDIPEGWEVVPIRKVARLESGHTPSRSHPEWWVNCYIPWFSLSDIWQVRPGRIEYVQDTAEQVSDLGLANSSARLLPSGTVMLSRTASVGFSAIMGVPMATTQDFANWVCGEKLSPEFLLYCLRGMPNEFDRLKMGSTHNTIYMPDIQKLTIALPPMTEQKSIVKSIRKSVGRLDELIDAAQSAITLLQERRAALISAAVTGKIDVRTPSTRSA